MNPQELLSEAQRNRDWQLDARRELHRNPETEFSLNHTLPFVRSKLEELGLKPLDCGKAGLTVTIGGKKPGKVFLLRADMDALPMAEETGLPFASDNGCMHACGHDMHTAMLLGAAALLKAHEEEINGTVKLMFQAAEEIFEGSKDMIAAGVLENPSVDAALMIHVMAGMPIPTGSVIVCGGGVSAPGADIFQIRVQGKGCHGSMPNTGIDPITAACHIVTSLQAIHARELALSEEAVLTIGSIQGGSAPNIIPDTVELSGSIRCYDEEVRAFLKQRLADIAQGIAASFRCTAQVSFGRGCPVLLNNPQLSKETAVYMKELLGPGKAFTQAELLAASGGKAMKASGSEDFAYISQQVPSIMLSLAAGNPQEGHGYPQHHPKVTFDEQVLPIGSAVHVWAALRYLEEHPL